MNTPALSVQLCCLMAEMHTCDGKDTQADPAEAALSGCFRLSRVCHIDVRVMHGAGLHR